MSRMWDWISYWFGGPKPKIKRPKQYKNWYDYDDWRG